MASWNERPVSDVRNINWAKMAFILMIPLAIAAGVLIGTF